MAKQKKWAQNYQIYRIIFVCKHTLKVMSCFSIYKIIVIHVNNNSIEFRLVVCFVLFDLKGRHSYIMDAVE